MKKALVLLSMIAAFALAACEPPADDGAVGDAPAAAPGDSGGAPAAPGGGMSDD